MIGVQRLQRRNKKVTKELNAAEWKVIEDKAHLEAMTHVEDQNNYSQPSPIEFDQKEDFCDPKIKKIVNKYLRIVKKRRATRFEKLFGSWTKESLYNQLF